MRPAVYLAALFLAGCGAATPETIDGAMQAYGQNRVAEAESLFRKIAADPAAGPRDKAQAHRQLGRIAWLVDGDSKRALAHADSAFAVGEDPCSSGQLKARVLHEAKRGEQLLSEVPALAAACEDRRDGDDIRLRGAAAAIDLASGGSRERLAAAERLIASAGEDERSSPGVSAMVLHLALLKGDAAVALQAWRDYFWLSGTDVPQGLASAFPDAARVFAEGVAAEARPAARLRLVDLLVRAGFAGPAESLARAGDLSRLAARDPAWRRASAYFEARRGLDGAILASNRRVARGGEPADMGSLLRGFEARLMAAAGLSGDPRAGLLRAYALYGYSGETNGHLGINLGHAIQRDRRAIEQYGHRAEVAFIALDNMIANGFTSWLWDGSAAVGGWTEEGPVIVQVRPEYVSTPLAGWSLSSDPAARGRFLDKARRRSRADLALLKDEEVAYLPGLADRLSLQVADQVARRARAAAGPAGDLRRAFLAEYWRASFQQSIFVHEGRHALDRRLVRGLARYDDSNLEYRAKLSELALADYPRLALLNINVGTIGDSGHGIANWRVLKSYVDWIRSHSAEIAGYDSRLPPLAQIDRLSDAQLRAVARTLDPILR